MAITLDLHLFVFFFRGELSAAAFTGCAEAAGDCMRSSVEDWDWVRVHFYALQSHSGELGSLFWCKEVREVIDEV